MGSRKVFFGLVFMVVFGLSEAQQRGKSKQNQNPAVPRPLAQGPQQTESRIPQVPQRYDPSNPVFAPQSLPVQTPTGSDFGRPSQDLYGVQSKELMLGPVAKLTWCFPSLPEEPQQPDILFELRHPVPANSVAAQGGENSIHVEVMEDFFGTGRPLMPSAFTLGGCTATGEDPSAQVLIFESELHGCGSTSLVTEDELVYMFSLIYTPQETSYGGPIVRSRGAVVGIECHYPRSTSLVFSRRLQHPPLLMLSRKLALSPLIGGRLLMRMIRCAAAVTQTVALGVEVISCLKICGGTEPMLDPSESRTMILVQCISTAQWQNKVLNHTV